MKKLFKHPIPVTVVAGEYESGKTIFALTTGYPLERVLMYDMELGATLYAESNPFVRIDLLSDMLAKHPKGVKNILIYEAWRDHMQRIPPGEFDVIIIDTVERIESGLADWVTANPAYFGHSSAQYTKMPGIFWADVKSLWSTLIQEMKARCEMVILIAHMRDVWKGNEPVKGKRERRGKDTLSELATLELEMVRVPGKDVPGAKRIKSRLIYGDIANPSSMRQALPTWIYPGTWGHIRDIMESPLEEDVPLPPPTQEELEEREMEKLRLKATIAQATLDGASAEGTPEPKLKTQKATPVAAFWQNANRYLDGIERNDLPDNWTRLQPKDKLEWLAEHGDKVAKESLESINTTWNWPQL